MPSYLDYQDEIQSQKDKRIKEAEEIAAQTLAPVDDFLNMDFTRPQAPVQVAPNIPTDITVKEPPVDSPYFQKPGKQSTPVQPDLGVQEVGKMDLPESYKGGNTRVNVREELLKRMGLSKPLPTASQDVEGTQAKPIPVDQELIAAQKQADRDREFYKLAESMNKFSDILSNQKHVSRLDEDLKYADRPITNLLQRRDALAKEEERKLAKEGQKLRQQEADLRLKGFILQAEEAGRQAQKFENDLVKSRMETDANSSINKAFRGMFANTPFGKELMAKDPDGFNSLTVANKDTLLSLSNAKDNNDTRKQIAADNAANRKAIADQTAAIKDANAQAKKEAQDRAEYVPGFERTENAPKIRDVDTAKFREQISNIGEVNDLIQEYWDLKDKEGRGVLPFSEARTQMQALEGRLIGKLKEADKLGALDRGVMELAEKNIPGAMTGAGEAKTKLELLQRSMLSSGNNRAKVLGYKWVDQPKLLGKNSTDTQPVNPPVQTPINQPAVNQPAYAPKTGYTLIEINGTPRYVPNDKVQEELSKPNRKLVR